MVSVRKWLAVLMLLSVLLLGCACTASQPDPGVTQSNEAFPTVPLPTAEDGTVAYRVTVLSDGGEPIPGVFVQLNQADPAVTNDQGVASWNLPQATYVVSLVELPAGYDYTSALQEFYFADDSCEMTITLMAQ